MAQILGHEIRRLVDGFPVNAKLTGATTVFPALGKNVVVTKVVLRCTAAVAITIGATAKVEKNPAAGDLFSAETLTAVLAAGDIWVFDAEAKGIILPSGTALDVNITVAATGTSQTLAADVIGYIIY